MLLDKKALLEIKRPLNIFTRKFYKHYQKSVNQIEFAIRLADRVDLNFGKYDSGDYDSSVDHDIA
jgi:hypothetical protein